MYTLPPSFVEIYLTTVCCLNQNNPHVSAFRALSSLVVCWWSEKSRFIGAEMRMQTSRRTELLQMLEVTTNGSGSHTGSQALGEIRRRLVDVFLWQLVWSCTSITVNAS